MNTRRGAALIAALSIALPAWAQAPLTSEDLNRQELDRLVSGTPAPGVATPPLVYSIAPPVSIVPGAFVPQPISGAYRYPFVSQYPVSWLYRYYDYPLPVTYEYISVGSSGYYAPVVLANWY